MARGNGTDTIAQSARAQSESLRTTLPVFVVKQLEISEGDELEWAIDKNENDWVAIISKKVNHHVRYRRSITKKAKR